MGDWKQVIGIVCVAVIALSGISAHAETVVYVADYGAIPDDGLDDTQQIRWAFGALPKEGPSRIVFQPGRYDISAETTAFVLLNFQNLIIDGNGAELVARGMMSVFSFGQGQSITVRNLVIDWDRPMFSTGEIIGGGANWMDVDIFPEFPVADNETVKAVNEYNPDTGWLLDDDMDVHYSILGTELVAPQVLRVIFSHTVRPHIGAWAVLRHIVGGHWAFYFGRCQNITVEDTIIYSAPGMGVQAFLTENITLRRVQIVPRPDTRRLMSTNIDATHFWECQGVIRYEDCHFEGMGDDGINIRVGSYHRILEQTASNRIIIDQPPRTWGGISVGDQIRFYGSSNLLPYAERTITQIDPRADNTSYEITIQDPVPSAMQTQDVICQVSRIPSLVHVSGTTIRGNRARAALLQAPNVLVENCHFERCNMGSLYLYSEIIYFFEAMSPENVIIRNNQIINCNYSRSTNGYTLGVFSLLENSPMPPLPGVHRNIVIEDNFIQGGNCSGIYVTSTDGYIIRNNTIVDPSQFPQRLGAHDAISVMNSRNGLVCGNWIMTTTPTPQPIATPTNHAMPYGVLEHADNFFISGWAKDPDFDGPILVQIYRNDVFEKIISAQHFRRDPEIGSHGFTWYHPGFGPGTHEIKVYAQGVDSLGAPTGEWVPLDSSPRSFTGPAPTPTAINAVLPVGSVALAVDGTTCTGWAKDDDWHGVVLVSFELDDIPFKEKRALRYHAEVGDHAFELDLPPSSQPRTLRAFALDVDATGRLTGATAELESSPLLIPAATGTISPSPTISPTATCRPENTPVPTPSIPLSLPTNTPTRTPSLTPTDTPTHEPTNTPTDTPTTTNTPTTTPTDTPTPEGPDMTATVTILMGRPGDANRDLFVNADDYRVVRDYFGQARWDIGDANADGFVNSADYRAVRDNFGQSYEE